MPIDELNRIAADNLAAILVGLALIVLVLLVAVVIQSARVRRAVGAYRALVRDGDGGSLGDVLDTHVARVETVAGRVTELDALSQDLRLRSVSSLQHIGLVRFNPFDDTGSDQSFALALLDDRRDGVVISSLHGRANTRLFAKPVEGGASKHTLSTEEEQAIRIAVSGTGPAAPGT